MRQIGNLANQEDAQRFRDYLLTREVKATVEPDDGQWAVWVYDEDRIPLAKDELAQFVADPRHDRYRKVSAVAERLREKEEARRARARKQQIRVRDRWERPVYARLPVVTTLIVASVAVTLLSDFGKQLEPVMRWVTFADLTNLQFPLGTLFPGMRDIAAGQVWRLVTPMFLHYGWLHLFFNCYWTYILGGAIESNRGSRRLAVMVLVFEPFSGLVEHVYSGSVAFGGMSGVGFGLFGYLWMKSKFQPELGLFLPPQIVMWMMFWFVLCFTGWVGPIANGGHAGGLIAGLAIGVAPVVWRNLMRN